MLLTLLGVTLLASTPNIPPSTCLNANNRSACGYSCRSTFADVRCAMTPYGTCSTFEGRVVCFDPPTAAIHHPPDEGLRPECKGVAGSTACGFNCLIAKGKVACAQTPYGVCREHYGELRCWDPPEGIIHEYGANTPRPQCLTSGTGIACGYDCKSDRSEVKCATTPRGRCEMHDNVLECFDPPALAQCVHGHTPDPEEIRKPKSQRKSERDESRRRTD
ncbi:hypothetical protein [Hyalangium versicolor]|uniref:hypothetical protein n=1 Tax=Hyalangium versicolor TaxID=2861190 RepID=UPI001CC92819|nr:hypothetical protein [Hyalangium versicolor]